MINVRDDLTEYKDLLMQCIIDCLNTFAISVKYTCIFVLNIL